VSRLPPIVSAATLLLLAACSSASLPAPSSAPVPTPTSSPTKVLRSVPGPLLVKPAAPPAVPLAGTSPRDHQRSGGPAPVRLEVGSIDISMPVVPVGVDERADMALPESVGDVGWYEFGARPTDSAGTTVLAAHVDSRRDGLGPFARLRDVRKGASITVITNGDRRVHYRVDSVDRIAKKTVPISDVFERDGDPRLVLITCGGAYDRGTGYRDNVVVTAFPQSGRS